MAGVSPAAGGKRPLDVDYNLVPFIDLLSCCIVFLLISAVWTQVAKIDVKPAPNLPGAAQAAEPEVKLTVRIRPGGYVVSDGRSSAELPKGAQGYPVQELDGKLTMLRSAYPSVSAITVQVDDNVPYREIIQVMDACLRRGLNDISVSG